MRPPKIKNICATLIWKVHNIKSYHVTIRNNIYPILDPNILDIRLPLDSEKGWTGDWLNHGFLIFQKEDFLGFFS